MVKLASNIWVKKSPFFGHTNLYQKSGWTFQTFGELRVEALYSASTFHPSELFTRKHSISCLQVHRRLCMPHTIEDPISYLLNLLPVNFLTKKERQSIDGWLIRWPTICAILLEMDCLAHSQVPDPSEPLLLHLHQVQQQYSDNWLSSLLTYFLYIFPLISKGFFNPPS